MPLRLPVVWITRASIPIASVFLLIFTSNAGLATTSAVHTKHAISGPGTWQVVRETAKVDGTFEDVWRGSDGSVVVLIGPPGGQISVSPETRTHGPGKEIDYARQLAIRVGIQKLAAPLSATGPVLASSIYNTYCAGVTSSDGHVYTYGCDTQYLDQQSGLDWYMADKMQVSARSDCSANYFCDHLRSLENWVTYPSGNTVIQWSPGSTLQVGSCSNLTISLTSNRTGITYSTTANICPSTMGPDRLNSLNFGSIWKGFPPDINSYYEAAEAEDEVHDPPNASPTLTYHTNTTWCSWCF